MEIWKPHQGPQEYALSLPDSVYETLYGGARGGGKAQPYTSEVKTVDGYKTLNLVEIGDKLIDPNGGITEVVGIYPQGKKQIYRVWFNDGSSVDCTDNHLWKVWFSNTKRRGGVYSLEEISKIISSTKNVNVYIPLTKPVEFKKTPIKLDPYVLGLLLGDGYFGKDAIKFSTKDKELLGAFRRAGYNVNYLGKCDYRVGAGYSGKKDKKGRFVARKNSLNKILKFYGLDGHTSYFKFIPFEYEFNSVDVRLGLLQGLMDTDGYIDDRGHMEFVSASKHLAYGVLNLVWSLGGYAKLSEKYGKNRVYIRFNNEIIPFRLKRKAERMKPYNGGISRLGRRIEKIEKTKVDDCVCIKVDNPLGLYLTDNYIVTHNTDAGIIWMTYPIEIPRYRGLVIRRNAEDLRDWCDRAFRIYSVFGAIATGMPSKFVFPSGAKIYTGHLKDDKAYSKYQGHEYQRMLIEELTQIPDERRYLQLISSCRSTVEGLQARIFATTNPGGAGHAWVKERYIDVAPPYTPYPDPISERKRIFIPAKVDDNPTLVKADPEYVKTLDALKSTDEELYKAWRLGDWNVFAGQVFSEFKRDKHVIKRFTPKMNLNHYLGIDWGYSGREGHKGAFAAVAFIVVKVKHYSQEFNRVFVYREWYDRLKESDDWAKILFNERIPDQYTEIIGDSSMFNPQTDGSQSIMESMEEVWEKMYGRSWCDPVRGTKNRISRVSSLHNWLSIAPDGLPYMVITDNCLHLIRTIPSLVYDEHKVEDVDTDLEDHLYDSLTYALGHVEWIPPVIGGIKKKEVRKYKTPPLDKLDLESFEISEERKRDWRV